MSSGRSPPTPGRARRAVRMRHSAAVEIAALTALYAVYEVVRGVRHASPRLAVGHALDIVRLERSLHIYAEGAVQRAFEHPAALLTVLAFAYPVLHVLATVGILAWAYRSRPADYPTIRTALIATTAIALVIYVVLPVAPPRLAGLAIRDTVSDQTPFNLSSSVLGRLYNPLAAVPSLHFAYALLMGTVLIVRSRRRVARAAGVLLPVVTLVVIVATGNHFFTDAAAGGVVAAMGFAIGLGTRSPRTAATASPPKRSSEQSIAGRPGSPGVSAFPLTRDQGSRGLVRPRHGARYVHRKEET
jgi:PAP2 superfamily